MQKLILLFALVTCGLAAPLDKVKEPSPIVDLIRPSPINPDIPSDPKPEEKITLIHDAEPKPAVPSKPVKLPGPYVLPRESLVRAKRVPKQSSESDENSSEEVKKPSLPPAASQASLLEDKTRKTSTTPVLSSTHSNDGTSSGAGTLPTSTVPTHARKPYSPQIHQHNEHLFKPTTEAHLNASPSSSTSTSPIVASTKAHVNDKRDIPVPLTRKYHHDNDGNNDDSDTKHKEEPSLPAKAQKEEVKQEEDKNEGHKPDPIAVAAAQHQAAIAHPIPVAELFAKKPSTE